MTVKQVRIEEMPVATDKDGNEVYDIPQLYEDLLINLFRENFERANGYLDEVRPSGWSIAPDTPSEFEELLSDHPYSKEFDDSKRDDGGTARPEFEEMDGKKDDLLKTAKIIESEFEVEGEKFTYSDLVELNGVPYSDGSLKGKVATQFKKHGFLSDSGDRRDGKKLWVWVKSWDQDKSQQDPVADGGVNEYNWTQVVQELAGAEVVRDDKRDWFTAKNFDPFIDVYRSLEEVTSLLDDLRASRSYLEHQNPSQKLVEWEKEDLEDIFTSLKNEFQSVFQTLHKLVDIGFDRITAWAEKHNVDLHNELDRFRPHKKQDRYLQRLEAKRFAIIDTYLTPLLTYDQYLTDTKRLKDVEDVFDAFMMWLRVMYEDIAVYIEDESSGDDLPIEDVVQDVLDTQVDAPSDENYVEWTKLVKIVQHKHTDSPRPKRILAALEELHKLGKAERTAEWRGLYVRDLADDDEQPELVVEIVYNDWGEVDFDHGKWRGEMLAQVG